MNILKKVYQYLMVRMNSREKILSVVLLTEGTLETGCLVRPEAVEQIVHTALDLNLILQAILPIKRWKRGGGYLV